jgi:hypothetical protein
MNLGGGVGQCRWGWGGEGGAYGSVLFVTAIGVFLYAEMLLASLAMHLVENSRSLATLVANFPVSF